MSSPPSRARRRARGIDVGINHSPVLLISSSTRSCGGSVSQKNADEDKDGAVPVVAITHAAREADLEAALAEIATCGVVTETPVRLADSRPAQNA